MIWWHFMGDSEIFTFCLQNQDRKYSVWKWMIKLRLWALGKLKFSCNFFQVFGGSHIPKNVWSFLFWFYLWRVSSNLKIARSTMKCSHFGKNFRVYFRNRWTWLLPLCILINNRRMSWHTDSTIHGQTIHPVEKFISLNLLKFLQG